MENQWAVYTLEACVLVTIVILFLSITSKLKSEDPKKTSSKLEEKSKECSESSSKSKACSKSKEVVNLVQNQRIHQRKIIFTL